MDSVKFSKKVTRKEMVCCFLLPTDSLSIICNDRKEQKSYLPEQYLSAQPGGGSGLEGRTHTEREREGY